MLHILYKVCMITMLITACKQAPRPVNEAVAADAPAEEPKMAGDCYLAISGNDSVLMQIVVENTSVAGHLHYRYQDKDKSGGTLFGNMRGDTLIADYKFMAEGTESEREVAFIRRGDNFIEGFGDSEERDGRVIFKNLSSLAFNGIPLQKANCDSLTKYFVK